MLTHNVTSPPSIAALRKGAFGPDVKVHSALMLKYRSFERPDHSISGSRAYSRRGGVHFISKPFTLDLLAAMMRAVLDE